MLFPKDKKWEEPGKMETTPMVDVIFILLAFFVVVSQLKENRLSMQLTSTRSGTPMKNSTQKSILVQINKKNQIFLGSKKVDLKELERLVQSHPRNIPVEIRSDRNSKNGVFLQVLDILKLKGFQEIQITVLRKRKGA